MDGRVEGWMERWIDMGMDEWMGRSMEGWMDRWNDGRMGGQDDDEVSVVRRKRSGSMVWAFHRH